ncbi:MAG: hypothetical protein AB7U38_07335 [Hyphomicrobiales bacterium]
MTHSRSAALSTAGHSPAEGSWRAAILFVLAALLIWLGGIFLVFENARLPASASGKVLALFPPRTTSDEGFRIIVAAGGEPVRPVMGGLMWVANSPEAGFAGRLTGAGATAVYGEIAMDAGPLLAGCGAWAARLARSEGPKPRFTP